MYQSKLQSEAADRLFEAILSLQSTEECYRFFEDLCTVTELRALSQRMEVAALFARRGNLYCHRRKNRRFYCNDFPRKPLPFLWRGWL